MCSLFMHFPHSGIVGPVIVQLQQKPHVSAKAATTAQQVSQHKLHNTDDDERSIRLQQRYEEMAYTTQTRTTGFGATLDTIAAELRGFFARRRLYRETLRELNGLSNRELADLGLHRSQIKRIAIEAVNDL